MSKLVIHSYQEFERFLGQELGVSDYLTITQEQINKFADATLDHQWIHTEPERARRDSPFGAAIAHGYLNLAITPHLWEEIAEFKNIKMMINYGIEKLKFNQPVMVNDQVRLRVKLHDLADLRGITKAQLKVDLEIRDKKKPAFSAILIFLYHFV
jgi:acyl dehydratase